MGNLQALILPSILLIVSAYLLGSVSFSILFTRMFKKVDVRNYGSGNAGMTNVLRTAGKTPAILTFVFDFLKCFVPVLVGYFILVKICNSNDISLEYAGIIKSLIGIACMIGHIFPIYFQFKGGKGVVTAAAMIAAVDWRVFIFVILVFIITFAIKKTVSLSSICAAITFPVATLLITYFVDYPSDSFYNLSYIYIVSSIALLACLIVVFKHTDNIKRIINGTEKPIISKK